MLRAGMVINQKEYSYILVTPARNEEAYIEKTIQSVISQTVLPKKWVIVSDGSTDHTHEIVEEYAANHHFIQLVRIEGHLKRNFGSKVDAFNAGYEKLKSIEYDYLGILDADVSFDRNYYESIMNKFQHNEKLGIAGGIRYDWHDGSFKRVLCARTSVGGPFQLFRRECYKNIGGFIPQKLGGEDAIVEIMARMHGWEVESFPEAKVYHYRRTGTATANIIQAKFLNGIKNYLLGYSPLFQIARSIYRCREQPYIFGSLVALSGYFWACFHRYERTVPADFLEYFKWEQSYRLRLVLFKGKGPSDRIS